jgi:FkbM family methyltransferase
MKKSTMYRCLQWFFQKTPKNQRMMTIFKPLLPSPIYGVCNGYWMELDVGEVIQRLMYLGEYESVQSQWVKDILKPGGTFLDVGANVGYFTTLAADLVGCNGQVVAFEPSPYAYTKLKTVLRDSHINQVCLFQSAAGDEDGQLDLYMPSENYLHSPSLVQSNESYTPVKVDVCRLESHPSLKSLKVIDLMKLDVEGFEPNVLRGMCAYLRAGRVRYLMCELNSGWLEANGSSCEGLLEMIKGIGFVVCKETKQATIVAPGGLVYRCQDILFQHV